MISKFTDKISSEEPPLKTQAEATAQSRKIYWPAVTVITIAVLGLAVWSMLDYSLPRWDDSCHLLRGDECATILKSREALSHKIAKLATFSSYYPPLIYYVHGILVALLGFSPLANVLPKFFWFGLSLVSLYLLGRKVFVDKRVATVAVAIFSTYPLILGSSHKFLVDIPMTAMVFASLWRLLEWKDKPTWPNATILGITMGLAFLSKQSAALFLAAPLAVLLIANLRRNRQSALMLVFAGAVASSLLLSWVIPNYSACRETVATLNGNGAPAASFQGSFSNLISYITQIPQAFSLVGLSGALASLLYFPAQRQLWLPALGVLSALLALTCVPWLPTTPQIRYAMPLLGFTALSTAALLVFLWQREAVLSKGLVLAFCGYMLLQYSFLNFVPIHNAASMPLQAFFPQSKDAYTPFEDWGHEWIVKTVDEAAHHQPAWLIVLPDKSKLTVGGIKYVAKLHNSPVQPTTWRVFTVQGYQFDYPEEMLTYPNYYLVMEGSQKKDGAKFIDQKTEQRFNNLISILKTSGNHERIGSKTLPDGSVLTLFNTKPLAKQTAADPAKIEQSSE